MDTPQHNTELEYMTDRLQWLLGTLMINQEELRMTDTIGYPNTDWTCVPIDRTFIFSMFEGKSIDYKNQRKQIKVGSSRQSSCYRGYV